MIVGAYEYLYKREFSEDKDFSRLFIYYYARMLRVEKYGTKCEDTDLIDQSTGKLTDVGCTIKSALAALKKVWCLFRKKMVI